MAADQRKKRANTFSLVACTSHDQYMENRKKLQVQRHNLNMRPNITLEWDNNKKSVVPKKNQISIARRHLIPFIEPSPRGPSILADVVSVPHEIFDLENLTDVLSYEVWQGHLSDKERNFLSQFLPKEPEPDSVVHDSVVQDLLAGDNFHFGNPFIKWGASLCIGKLHPDNVLLEEQRVKTVKKAYYSQLQKYHDDMIENLQMCKEEWVSFKDPGVNKTQNIWSCRKYGEPSRLPSETLLYEENLVATPESCSWINSEVAYSSDNQNSGMMHEESQRRKDSLNKVFNNHSTGLKGTPIPRKGENIHKRNIQNGDGTKYMSYIKVSKEQHERVKICMDCPGNSIQPRFLNNVLGSIDNLNIQPYERFEEEEKKKLNDYWLKLATKDVPEGFVSWGKRHIQRQELLHSLGEELGQKLEQKLASLKEEKLDFQNKRRRHALDAEPEVLPLTTIEVAGKELTDNLIQQQSNNTEASCEKMPEIKDEKEVKCNGISEPQIHYHADIIEDDNVPNHVNDRAHNEKQTAAPNSTPRSPIVTPSPGFLQNQDQHQPSVSSLNCDPHNNSMGMETCGGNACAKIGEDPQAVSENLNPVDMPVDQGNLLASTCEVWPVGDVRGSYYQSICQNAGYGSAQELSMGHPQFIQGQEVRILDLETDGQNKDAGSETLHRQPDDITFFNSYSQQDRNEFLQSFFRGQSNNMSYHQQQKHPVLDFQPRNDLIMETGQFPEHFREQVHPSLHLDPRQKRLNELYTSPNVHETTYSGGGHFAIPRHEGLPINIHEWAGINKARGVVPSPQPHMDSSELNQNWCTIENGTRDGWPSSFEIAVGVNPVLSSRSNSDQTLFSVISECNGLRPHTGYESVGHTEQLMQTGSYSGIGAIPLSNSFLQQSPNRLNYMGSGHDGSAGIKMNSLGWVGMPQQNSGMQESIAKPFLRSWNQQQQG